MEVHGTLLLLRLRAKSSRARKALIQKTCFLFLPVCVSVCARQRRNVTTPAPILEDTTAEGKTTERYATIKALGKRACVRSKRSLKGSLLILQRDAKRLRVSGRTAISIQVETAGSCDELDIHKICRRFFTVQDMPCLAN